MSRASQFGRILRAAATAGPYPAALAAYARGRRNAYQKVVEFAQLIALVKRHRPAVVVEIGTARGGTLWTWCKVAADDALIVSIDLPGGPFGGGYSEEFAPAMRRYAERGQRVELIRADSHETATLEEVTRILDGRLTDLLFIDGDHHYEGVRRDFEMYAPLAQEFVVFHDILPHDDPDCHVDRFWNEVKMRYRNEEIIDLQHVDPTFGRYGGLGVLYLSRTGS